MNPFSHFLFRLIKGGIGVYLLWVAFQIFPFIRPFSLNEGILHLIYSALVHIVFVYLTYVLTIYVIGGKSLVHKIAYTHGITKISLAHVIFRLLALALGLGGLWILYDHYILGHHPDLFLHARHYVRPELLIVFFLIYGIWGTDFLEKLTTERFGKASPAQKKSIEKFTWFILIFSILFAIWVVSLGFTH